MSLSIGCLSEGLCFPESTLPVVHLTCNSFVCADSSLPVQVPFHPLIFVRVLSSPALLSSDAFCPQTCNPFWYYPLWVRSIISFGLRILLWNKLVRGLKPSSTWDPAMSVWVGLAFTVVGIFRVPPLHFPFVPYN